MCRGPNGMQKMHEFRMHGMYCGRNFFTKEEQIEHLKLYKEWLEKEKQGVEETIEKLKKAS